MLQPDVQQRTRAGGSHAEPTVHLDGLHKTFKGGVTAVNSLSLTVEQGQVFGLLGPNGSGKTTALRMLVGLVFPTAGAAYLFGQRVTPGHPVLRRVGALIEGPAFIPHLTGKQNLDLYWRAGGIHPAVAHLSEALEVADLGSAIEKKVRTYSRGMQQRLALAQALLGAPELLILDEPTVGLDPQEMHEIRALIRRVASAGVTVLLSSHILSEVEQICSHAAVIDHGRLLASGTLAELIQANNAIDLEVDNPSAARLVLDQMQGVTVTEAEGCSFVLRLDGVARERVVAALSGNGVGVRTVASRRSLEDSFLKLLCEESQ